MYIINKIEQKMFYYRKLSICLMYYVTLIYQPDERWNTVDLSYRVMTKSDLKKYIIEIFYEIRQLDKKTQNDIIRKIIKVGKFGESDETYTLMIINGIHSVDFNISDVQSEASKYSLKHYYKKIDNGASLDSN